jgi:GT2 family glycosyltransferase
MADANLYRAKTNTEVPLEWVIVESGSERYENEANIYIHEPERTTPNIAVNKGFKACTGDYVIFFSTDTEVSDKWVEHMLECFKHHSDCGIASLGNSEARDKHKNEIVEGLFFSVCMMKKEDAWLDPEYTCVFDDTDLIFRLHLQGKKFYKNLNGYVHHRPHSTLGDFGGNRTEYLRSLEYFKNKYKKYSDDKWYKKFTNG